MDHSKFTIEFKDSILNYLCQSLTPYTCSHFDWRELDSDFGLINTCLNQFAERGFIQESFSVMRTGYCSVILTSSAIDFLRMGGFMAEYEIFDINMSKAILELDKLQSDPSLKDYVEKISGVTSILANSVAAFSTLFGSAK